MVNKIQPFEYDLYMRADTNTTGHNQWFYFSIKYNQPLMKGKTITFNICNFTKPHSLYTYGMRVCVAKKSQGFEWHKEGDKIQYGRSKVVRKQHTDPLLVRYYFNLTF